MGANNFGRNPDNLPLYWFMPFDEYESIIENNPTLVDEDGDLTKEGEMYFKNTTVLWMEEQEQLKNDISDFLDSLDRRNDDDYGTGEDDDQYWACHYAIKDDYGLIHLEGGYDTGICVAVTSGYLDLPPRYKRMVRDFLDEEAKKYGLVDYYGRTQPEYKEFEL